MAGGFNVLQFKHGPFWNFTYLLWCDSTREAAIIDPAWDTPRVLAAAREADLHVRHVLLTHGHSDHAHGLRDVVRAFGARAYVHHGEAGELLPHFDSDTHRLEGGEVLHIGATPLSVLHTPGHSRGSLSFLAAGRLFTGDTLNVGLPGTPSSEPGAIEALWYSLRHVVGALPGETAVYPGHDAGPTPQSTLAKEFETNRGLRCATFDEFVTVIERATGRSYRD